MLETAEKEGYDELIDNEYKALLEKVKGSKEKDLDLYKKQIKELLQNEIVSRYYYQNGRVINAFQSDNTLDEAIKILKDQKRYNNILAPK